MQSIKVAFGEFWPGFNNHDNYFTRILRKSYTVDISDQPDLYFFTHPYNGQRDYLRYKCHRVFLGWENVRADWSCCDYVLDSDILNGNPRHKRWPIWASWNPQKLVEPKNPEAFLQKKKFACMVVSNPNAKERINFFHQLSKYKRVDSGGQHLNNVGGPVKNKLKFIEDYKFVISFENSSYPGYTTEKLIEPMLTNCIPIYWGNREVSRDFNTKSFVHVNQFGSFEEAIERIIELDKDEEKFLQVIKEPWFPNNRIPVDMSEESLKRFFDFVISDMKIRKPVACSLLNVSLHKLALLKNRILIALSSKIEALR